MKINFDALICDLDGKPVLEEVKTTLEDGTKHTTTRPLTLRVAAVTALMTPLRTDDGMGGAEKLGLWVLAQKIHAGATEIDIEDAKTVKDRIGKVYYTAVSGPAWQLLEGRE